MAYVPRLPTWNLTVNRYSFNLADRTRTAGASFLAQMYPPVRTSDNEGASDGYLVYPKESDVLKDPREYNGLGNDAITITYLGKVYGFVVEQVLPRFAAFPNQHLMALLRRMTADELTNILGPVALPGADPLPAFDTEALVFHLVDDGTTPATEVGTMMGHFLGSWQLDDTAIATTFDFALADYDLVKAWILYDTTPAEYDVLRIEVPPNSGEYRYYWVDDTVVQNFGQPDSFVRAVLLPLSASQIIPAFVVPDPSNSSISAAPTSVLANGTATTTVSGTILDASSNPVVGQTVSISSSGSAVIAGTSTTDASGNWSTTATDTVSETITFSALCLGITIGPSNTVAFSAFSGDMNLIFTGVSNGDCLSCGDFDTGGGGITVPNTLANSWDYNTLTGACITSGKWNISYNPISFVLDATMLVDEGAGTYTAVHYQVDATTWDWASPIVLDLDTGTTFCGWPLTVTVTPI